MRIIYVWRQNEKKKQKFENERVVEVKTKQTREISKSKRRIHSIRGIIYTKWSEMCTEYVKAANKNKKMENKGWSQFDYERAAKWYTHAHLHKREYVGLFEAA